MSPAAAIAWLTTLLTERYGHPVRLARTGNEWQLALPGQEGMLTFTGTFQDTPNGTSDLPCANWDPVPEGHAGPLGVPLPAPGVDNLPTPLISKTSDGLHLGYDIPGFAFWMLNRLEEIGRTDLDNHERFPATASHAYRHGYLERPIVDEWLHVLEQVIRRQWPDLHLKRHTPSIVVSHDVDVPSYLTFRPLPRVVRSAVGGLLKHGRLREAFLNPWIRIRSRKALHTSDPLNTFEWIMDQSDRRGLKSAFYFICGRTDPTKDADYEPEHPAIRALMRHIHSRGHEIGLHPSYATYLKPAFIKAEADRLRRICADEGIRQREWGGRMHYLRWEHPTTLAAWDAAGMAYDTTLGYADRPGFRCGTCFEYPGFDPINDRPLSLRVRPLIAMECTVMAPRYLGLGNGEAALEKFLQLKRACSAVGGQFTLLWHNSELRFKQQRSLYTNVLDL